MKQASDDTSTSILATWSSWRCSAGSNSPAPSNSAGVAPVQGAAVAGLNDLCDHLVLDDAAPVLPRGDARNHPAEPLHVVEVGEAGVLPGNRVIGGRALDRMHLAVDVLGEGQGERTDVDADIHDPLTA